MINKVLTDTHTHTVGSTHAYSTLKENIDEAKRKGLELIVITDHAPAIPDSPHIWHFVTPHNFPRVINGIIVLHGIETSICDLKGNIDVPAREAGFLEVVIASFHSPVFLPRTKEEHTDAYLNVIKNPLVDIIGHSGTADYVYDYEPVIRAAKENNVCIEINNHSFICRKGTIENCREIALICKKVGTNVVVSSDAHIFCDVGNFTIALKMLNDIDFPEELVINSSADKFIKYIEAKKGIKLT